MPSTTLPNESDRLEPLTAEPIDRRPAVVGAPRGRQDRPAVGTAVVAEIIRAGPAAAEQMPYVGDPTHASMAELIKSQRDEDAATDDPRRRRWVGASVTITLLAAAFAWIAWLLS